MAAVIMTTSRDNHGYYHLVDSETKQTLASIDRISAGKKPLLKWAKENGITVAWEQAA